MAFLRQVVATVSLFLLAGALVQLGTVAPSAVGAERLSSPLSPSARRHSHLWLGAAAHGGGLSFLQRGKGRRRGGRNAGEDEEDDGDRGSQSRQGEDDHLDEKSSQSRTGDKDGEAADDEGSLAEADRDEEGSHRHSHSDDGEEVEEEPAAQHGGDEQGQAEDLESAGSAAHHSASDKGSVSGKSGESGRSHADEEEADQGESGRAQEEEEEALHAAADGSKRAGRPTRDEEDEEGGRTSAGEEEAFERDSHGAKSKAAERDDFDEGSQQSSRSEKHGGASEDESRREHDEEGDSTRELSHEDEGHSSGGKRGRTKKRRLETGEEEDEDEFSSQRRHRKSGGKVPKRKHAKEAPAPKASAAEHQAPVDPDAPFLGYKNRADVCLAVGCRTAHGSNSDDAIQGCSPVVECADCSGTPAEATSKSCRRWRLSSANEIVLANGIFKIPSGAMKDGDHIRVRIAWDREVASGVNVCAPDVRQVAALVKGTGSGANFPIYRTAAVQLTAQRSAEKPARKRGQTKANEAASVAFSVQLPAKDGRSAAHSQVPALQPVCLADESSIGPVDLEPNGLSSLFAASWFSFPAATTSAHLTKEIMLAFHCKGDNCATEVVTGCVRLLCPATLPQVEAKLLVKAPAASAPTLPQKAAGYPVVAGYPMWGFQPTSMVPAFRGMQPTPIAGRIPLGTAARPVGMGPGRFFGMPR